MHLGLLTVPVGQLQDRNPCVLITSDGCPISCMCSRMSLVPLEIVVRRISLLCELLSLWLFPQNPVIVEGCLDEVLSFKHLDKRILSVEPRDLFDEYTAMDNKNDPFGKNRSGHGIFGCGRNDIRISCNSLSPSYLFRVYVFYISELYSCHSVIYFSNC